jgi:hypothetical protein
MRGDRLRVRWYQLPHTQRDTSRHREQCLHPRRSSCGKPTRLIEIGRRTPSECHCFSPSASGSLIASCRMPSMSLKN